MQKGEPALSLSGVAYRYPLTNWLTPWEKKWGAGIHDVDLMVESGSILGLIGPNGSGKTTLLHTIAGLHGRHKGTIKFLGQDRRKLGWESAQNHIGLMPERVNWSGTTTPHEILNRLITMRGLHESPNNLLKIVGMSKRMHTPLDNMSQGMKQRLTLACALLGNPEILLLDEPLNGLDPVAQAAFRKLLRDLANRGTTVIVSSHNLNEMELFVDSLAILHRGQMVASGSISEVQNILGCQPQLVVAGNGWCPPSSGSFGRGIVLEKCEPWPGEEWRISLHKNGSWSSKQRHNILDSIEGSGGKICLLQMVQPTLEDMLSAATGETADTIGLDVGDDSMIPLRKLGVEEDE